MFLNLCVVLLGDYKKTSDSGGSPNHVFYSQTNDIDESCSEFYYTDKITEGMICVSASDCSSKHNGYAYSYGDKKKCLKVAPANKDEFQEESGVYSCKREMFIAITETDVKCVTKKNCSGFIIDGAECQLVG